MPSATSSFFKYRVVQGNVRAEGEWEGEWKGGVAGYTPLWSYHVILEGHISMFQNNMVWEVYYGKSSRELQKLRASIVCKARWHTILFTESSSLISCYYHSYLLRCPCDCSDHFVLQATMEQFVHHGWSHIHCWLDAPNFRCQKSVVEPPIVTRLISSHACVKRKWDWVPSTWLNRNSRNPISSTKLDLSS